MAEAGTGAALRAWHIGRPVRALTGTAACTMANTVLRLVPPGVLAGLTERGRSGRMELEQLARATLRLVVRRVVAAVLETTDLTELVRRHADLDAVAAGLDVAALAARVDLDAVVARVDIVGIAREVIDAIDLPEIVRHSTGTLTSDTIRTVRREAMQADEVVAGLLDRFLRRQVRRVSAPS